jgi:hypothetical protein
MPLYQHLKLKNTNKMEIKIEIGNSNHAKYAQGICDIIAEAAQKRGTGIAKRKPEYIAEKLMDGKSVIALHNNEVAGFSYIEVWEHGRYVANSGLIVAPKFRQLGLAKRIKKAVFELSREKYPTAKIFGITTSLAVLKINSELGYKPVTFSELPQDEVFWKGCSTCPNFDILTRTEKKMCLCTGMLAPSKVEVEQMKFDLSHMVIG